MKEQKRTKLTELRLPSYRGEMLLLKYLELRRENPPTVENLPEDFDEFVDPVAAPPPRQPERALRYLDDLINMQYARVVEKPGVGRVVELTPIGGFSAEGIGLDSELRMQWEKQKERL